MQGNFKFLAGFLAGMAGIGAANAADLGRPAPAAVDYVKVCDMYGAGFFYIPGTETCLRVGGGVRFDASYTQADFILNFSPRRYVSPYPYRNWNTISTLARMRLDFEARTMSEFGLLRSVARVEHEVGSFNEPFDPASLFTRNTAINRTILREGYIQWGGLTAGITYSLFNLPYFLTYSNPFTADQRTNMLAYTFSQGGFSASVALEDPSARRGFLGPYGLFGLTAGNNTNYAGVKYPDLIGVLKYSSPTFSVQASGALHHVTRSSFIYAQTLRNVRSVPGADDWGFAGQIGAEWKFTPRGSLYGGVAYTEGASAFSGIGADDDRLGGGSGFAATDGYVRIRNGKFEPTKIISTHIGAGYGVTDTVRVAGSFGYARVEDDFRGIVNFGTGVRGFRTDYDAYKVLGLIEWNPTERLRIGAEVGYTAIEFDGDELKKSVPNPVNGLRYRVQDSDRLSVLLRFDRRF